MFIAHLPSGYITAKYVFSKTQTSNIYWKGFLVCALIGSVAPDFDLLYFYLWDNRQHHHHSYWSHYPILWFPLLLTTFYLKRFLKSYSIYLGIFLLCDCIHLILDSIVGDILWLAPFFDTPFAFATAPNIVSPWWLNFFIHWSFLLEIMISFWSYRIFYCSVKKDN